MKYTVSLLALTLCCNSALAGPIADRFAPGVLGMPWNLSLDFVIGVFPQGDHVYATSPGERAYRVRDDQDFLGVVRSGHTVVYWFDKKDKVASITLSFPYERKDELLGALISTFGAPHRTWLEGRQRLTGWRDESGICIALITTIDSNHGIAWLQIDRPD